MNKEEIQRYKRKLSDLDYFYQDCDCFICRLENKLFSVFGVDTHVPFSHCKEMTIDEHYFYSQVVLNPEFFESVDEKPKADQYLDSWPKYTQIEKSDYNYKVTYALVNMNYVTGDFEFEFYESAIGNQLKEIKEGHEKWLLKKRAVVLKRTFK